MLSCQSQTRLEQERTGLNRREQSPSQPLICIQYTSHAPASVFAQRLNRTCWSWALIGEQKSRSFAFGFRSPGRARRHALAVAPFWLPSRNATKGTGHLPHFRWSTGWGGGWGERAGDILGGKRVSASLANLDPVQCTGSRQPPKKAVKKDWRHQTPPPLNLTPKIAEQLFLKTVAVTISP